jgi:hypothetical protein
MSTSKIENNEKKEHIPNYSDLLALWAIQDNLLQSYRMIFITMQSIFVTIGSTQLGTITFVVMATSGLFSLYMWFTICVARGDSVYLIQAMIQEFEQGNVIRNPLLAFKQQQNEYRLVNRLYRISNAFLDLKDGGITRRKMELFLPIMFLMLWIIFGILSYMVWDGKSHIFGFLIISDIL